MSYKIVVSDKQEIEVIQDKWMPPDMCVVVTEHAWHVFSKGRSMILGESAVRDIYREALDRLGLGT